MRSPEQLRLRGPLPTYNAGAISSAGTSVVPATICAMGIVAVIAWILMVNAVSWHIFAANSDAANAALAGHAMAHGNVLLTGWRLPVDTYWPVDLGLYALYAAVAGVGPAAPHVVPLAIFVALLVVSVSLAAQWALGWRRVAAAGTAFLIIGLPAPALAHFLLQGPDHIATVVFCLGAFALLSASESRWRPAVAAVVLGIALVGDPIALAIGVVPVVGAGAAAAVRARRWQPLVPPLAAAGVAWAGALGVRHLLSAAGQKTAPALPIVTSAFGRNARAVPEKLADLLGVGPNSALSTVPRVVHAVGLLAVVAGAVVATVALTATLRALLTRSAVEEFGAVPTRWLDAVLALGFWGALGSFVLAVVDKNDPANMRYLVPAVVFGAILAGRYVGRTKLALTPRAWLAAAPAAVVVGVYVLGTMAPIHDPAPPGPRVLSAWLEARGLHRGIGPYWDASAVTVDTSQRVTIRAVISREGRLRPYHFYASLAWYRPQQRVVEPSFLVYEPGQPWGGVDAQSAARTFGHPASTTRVDRWEVLVWNRDILGELGTPVTG